MTRTPKNNCNFRLTVRDGCVFKEVFLSRAIDRDSLIALGYYGSVARLNNRLTKLVGGRYLRRIAFPTRPTSCQSVYLLDREAIDIVTRLVDFDRCEIARVARQEPTRAFIEHSLLIVQLRLLIEQDARRRGYKVETFGHEALVRHEYVEVVRGKQFRRIVKPDAYVAVVHDGVRHHMFLEADRANVSIAQERRSYERYARYANGVFADAYNADSFNVCVITLGGGRRVSHLLNQTKNIEQPKFRFATLDAVRREGFFGAVWESSGICSPTSPFVEPVEVSR